MLTFNLCFNQSVGTVTLAQYRFFNFACRVARHLVKDDFSRAFVTRQVHTEIVYFLLCAAFVLLNFNNCSRNFTKTAVGQADNRNVLDFVIAAQEVFNLNRVNIFTARDNNVFFCGLQGK